MASSDGFRIVVKGKQTHGARPWGGVDPIVVAAQIVLGLQTIASRQVDVTLEPSIITVGMIRGGNRSNIIPDEVEMVGTVRTFNEAMRKDIHARIRKTAETIAQSAGASAVTTVSYGYDVTYNNEKLAERAVATLKRVAGASNVVVSPKVTGAEDFSAYQKVIPGLFFFLGVPPKDLAHEISASLEIPTIGIGAGVGCDGQVLVMHDLLGLAEEPPPRFARQYVSLLDIAQRAVRMYVDDVRNQKFPSDHESY